ncbi:hypothetical protein RIF29_10304 [Crotalaria pallida]|uniref:F-box domain-containing protein n=1 Tax=Crotalaria pallida TaxID=3830 RepID=A0AAN9FYW5_CROPI
MDRISYLPTFILHDILSRLSEFDVASTSVLSKTWHDIWSTFPILSFNSFYRTLHIADADRTNPQIIQEHKKKLNDFMASVDRSLQTLHDRGLTINEFNISMVFFYSQYDPQTIPIRIDDWIKIASESGVKVLKLRLQHIGICLSDSLGKYYGLPLGADEAKSLSLSDVYFGHDQVVDVDAPSLECLHFGKKYLELPSKINMDNCSSLRELILTSVSSIFVTSQWLLELFGKFSLLEKLELDRCHMSERIKISSARLKVLNFRAPKDFGLEEIETDTPNLESCTYRVVDSKMPVISFLNASTRLEFNILFNIRHHLDFELLRKSIQCIKPQNVMAPVTLTTIYCLTKFDLKALQDISLPSQRIKLLNLHGATLEDEFCFPLVTALFWCFHPTIISLKPKYCSPMFTEAKPDLDCLTLTGLTSLNPWPLDQFYGHKHLDSRVRENMHMIPENICFFVWLACHGAVLTNATRRCLSLSGVCTRCSGHEESFTLDYKVLNT